ncbi:MAG TPA: hypothetical protein VMV94_05720 [Phycisphaerae bacterium]|nr:hypothetical protein [Phycisphaerae bacterium]
METSDQPTASVPNRRCCLQSPAHAGKRTLSGLLALLVLMWAQTPANAGTIEDLALAFGGQSHSWANAAPRPVLAFSGPIGVFIPCKPAGLAAGGFSGSFILWSAAPGSIWFSDLILASNFNAGYHAHGGAALSHARFVQARSSLDATGTAYGNSPIVVSSEGLYPSLDRLMITAPSITIRTAGSLTPHPTLAASMSVTGDIDTAALWGRYALLGRIGRIEAEQHSWPQGAR